MISGSVRPVLISLFAVLFGVVQLFCVCMSASATPLNIQETAPQTQVVSFGLAHSVVGGTASIGDHGEDHNSPHDHDSEHEHLEDCAHCNGLDVVAASSDQGVLATMPAPSYEKAILPKTVERPITPALMAPAALGGLRWLDPPRPTPVTLKIRLLN